MGTGNEREIKVYLEVDGETVEIKPDFAEVKFCGGQEGAESLEKMECEFTARMKLPKCMRCRSRKRFVKLLMASGIQRNVARVLAEGSVVWRNRRGMPDSMKESYQGYFTELWLRGFVKR